MPLSNPIINDPQRVTAGAWLPFAWCNLRRNPFGELTRGERAELAVVDLSPLINHVRTNHSAVQLIGACGRGKTTRMLALHQYLPQSSYVYLPQDGPCPAIATGEPVLIDEAQRLPRRVRHQIFQSGLPLVLATHRNLWYPLRRAGYRVLTYRIGSTNDAQLIHQVMNRRIQASSLDSNQVVPELSMDEASWLQKKFGSNLRAIESYLYEVVQTQVNSHGEMRFID